MSKRKSMVLAVAGLFAAASSYAADRVLGGAIVSAAGQKLEGVTVSAKLEGSPITTSVYTDTSGTYVFPPLPEGKYRVWAQALGFEAARGEVDTTKSRRQNLTLAEITDPERRFRQLPGEMMVAALPEATPQDAHMKKILMNNCTACHSTSYMLQFKFDEAGWNKIINLMKVVPNNGVFPGPTAKANAIVDRSQKQLAAYLARARGPGESSMKIASRPRPTGEAARAVWTLYDLPLNAEVGIGAGTKYNPNDGTDWALGTTSKMGQLPHDGGLGLDGTIYFTLNNPNRVGTIGKVDPKTGEVKFIKADASGGRAATAHGLVRDGEGNFWFDVNPGRRGLGKLDVKTDSITIYQTPDNMSPLGGAVTMDVDGKGMIWASTPSGAVRFDPKAERFMEFKSLTKAVRGSGATYGAAGDRDGNGWWAQMAMDTIVKGDVATGKAIEIKLPPVKVEHITSEDRQFYDTVDGLSFNTPSISQQGPRRMGTDKNANVLWVGNSWGATLARIDTKTMETRLIPFPDQTMQPYHIAVDAKHNVWGNLWTSDRLVKLDPRTNRWTIFDLPVRGTEIRHIALLEKGDKLHVVVPVYRSNQMGVLTVRSEAEIAAQKGQAQ